MEDKTGTQPDYTELKEFFQYLVELGVAQEGYSAESLASYFGEYKEKQLITLKETQRNKRLEDYDVDDLKIEQQKRDAIQYYQEQEEAARNLERIARRNSGFDNTRC